jgi:hypothetical protein
MIDPRISQVMALAQDGTPFFDNTIVSRLSSIGGEIAAIKAKLNAVGMTSLASSLDGYDTSSITDLSAHIETGQVTLMSRLSTFASSAAVSNSSSIGDAFGPVLRARGLLSSIDDLDTMLDDIDTPDLEALVTARVAQVQALPAQVATIISAEDAFFTQSSSTLANYMQSVEIVNMFESFPLKAVLGAAVSEDMLAVLKSITAPDDEQ